MDTADLSEPEREALLALKKARDAHPEADCFEHDGTSVRMPGAGKDITLSIDRDTLRQLGHRDLVHFTRERDSVGRGRWRFELTARSDDFV